ncbi:Flp pilus assembly protein CpaB [Streptomyces laurentii]|uniref:Flp pilus assembly protein CpaB n=1 Tax=Streptomyces laurentii TaxID=39478 RepID=UPI003681B638
MNSRQRRGVILLLLSVLCALGAFAGVLAVISDVNSKVGPEVTAYRIKGDIAPYTPLGPDRFEKIKMPERWLPATAVTDLRRTQGKIAVTTLKSGSLLQSDMIVDRPALEPGQQEIAIMIDAATGVAGKITPGAAVNIYATFSGSGERGGGRAANQTPQSKLIVAGAKVLAIGKITPIENQDDRGGRATDGVPITFALNTADTQRVAYAESFAQHVRLALVAPGSAATPDPRDRTYTLDKDK